MCTKLAGRGIFWVSERGGASREIATPRLLEWKSERVSEPHRIWGGEADVKNRTRLWWCGRVNTPQGTSLGGAVVVGTGGWAVGGQLAGLLWPTVGTQWSRKG